MNLVPFCQQGTSSINIKLVNNVRFISDDCLTKSHPDPIDRIRSWYDFWDAIEPSGEPHHMAFKDADMSLAEFARWEIVTGGFAEIFLDGTDGLDSFDFIGITERFDEDLAKLAHRLNWTTTPRPGVRANTTPKDPTPVDAATRQVIERHHEFEVDFYRRAAERFA